jgi:hypothetical protein
MRQRSPPCQALPTPLARCGGHGWIPQQRGLSRVDKLGVACIAADCLWPRCVLVAHIFECAGSPCRCAGSTGFVAINNADCAWTATFSTDLANGVYCDVIHGTVSSGVCSGPTYVLNRETMSERDGAHRGFQVYRQLRQLIGDHQRARCGCDSYSRDNEGNRHWAARGR